MLLQKLYTIVLLLGTAVAIFLGRDIFPFSDYPMYSKPFEPQKGYFRHEIRGVTIAGSEVDVDVFKYMPPFWKSSLRETILIDYNKEKIRTKLKAALLYYNDLSKSNGAESFQALRLYRYKLDWPVIVEDIKEDNKFSGNMGPHREILVEVSL